MSSGVLAKQGEGLEPNRGFSSWFMHTPALHTASTIPLRAGGNWEPRALENHFLLLTVKQDGSYQLCH